MKDVLELIGIIIVAGFIVSYLMWRVDRGKNTPRISFKLFKEMYQLNPKKWSMYENYLFVNYADNTSHRVDFNNFIDLLRYERFRKKIRKNKIKQTRYNAEVELVNELQKEIDKYQKENIEEVKVHLEKETIPSECEGDCGWCKTSIIKKCPKFIKENEAIE